MKRNQHSPGCSGSQNLLESTVHPPRPAWRSGYHPRPVSSAVLPAGCPDAGRRAYKRCARGRLLRGRGRVLVVLADHDRLHLDLGITWILLKCRIAGLGRRLASGSAREQVSQSLQAQNPPLQSPHAQARNSDCLLPFPRVPGQLAGRLRLGASQGRRQVWPWLAWGSRRAHGQGGPSLPGQSLPVWPQVTAAHHGLESLADQGVPGRWSRESQEEVPALPVSPVSSPRSATTGRDGSWPHPVQVENHQIPTPRHPQLAP